MNLKTVLVKACLLLVMSGASHASDFEITEVLKLGPGPNYQWSLKNDRIACASSHRNGTSSLVVYDTSGREIKHWKLEWPCHTLAWVDSSRISVRLRWKPTRDSKHIEILVLHLDSPKVDTVLVYTDTMMITQSQDGSRISHTEFQTLGPYLSNEGTAYYKVYDGRRWTYHLIDKNLRPQEAMKSNHVLLGGGGGMYSVSLDGTDTLVLLDSVVSSSLLDPSGSYMWVPGYLLPLAAGEVINIRDSEVMANRPAGTYLGFGRAHFNPTRPELVFGTVYGDGHYEEWGTPHVLDYSSMTYTPLSGPPPVADGKRFQFSPSCKWLAFFTSDGLHLARIGGR